MVSWLVFVASAVACGGLFCDPGPNYDETAVNQSAEEVLFSVDERAGTVTTHVKIFYEGPVDSFSWVVPVPGVPELTTGSDALFTALRVTDAAYELVRVTEPCSTGGTGAGTGTGTGTGWSGTTTGTAGGEPTPTVPGVDVVAAQVVGPFETVVLAADDSTALTLWLSLNGYAVPPGFDPAVAPYVAAGQYFVAMKLAKDNDVGDLVPIVMTYPGDRAIIPLTLTRVAALPDMQLRIYVVGQHRAVPANYLHVVPNPVAIDWWRDGGNGGQVTSRAVDEAGGHAFVTDFVGSGAGIAAEVFRGDWTVSGLEEASDAFEFLVEIARRGLPADETMLAALGATVPVPPALAAAGVSPEELYACPACYEAELRAAPFDAVQAAADVEALVLAPRRSVAQLLTEQPVLTRLTSTVSPEEMTVDPMFVLNADMDQVAPSLRSATLTTWCGLGPDGAPRDLDVGFPMVIGMPTPQALSSRGLDDFGFLERLELPAAWIVERTGPSGLPEVLVDNTEEILDAVQRSNRSVSDDALDDDRSGFVGCGCDGTGSGGWALGGVALAFAAGARVNRRGPRGPTGAGVPPRAPPGPGPRGVAGRG